MPLDAGAPNDAVVARLESLAAEDLAAQDPATDRDPAMAEACRAGLWLYHGHLDRSHQISQGLDTPAGCYWHGLMHRREGDHGNAKYWFRRVGDHAIHAALQATASGLASAAQDPDAGFLAGQDAWDAAAFVDLCAAVKDGRAACEALCRQIQAREWALLFQHCYGLAV